MEGVHECPGCAALPTGGRLCWLLSDGRQGTEAMALGIASVLGVQAHLKRVDARTQWRGVAAWAPDDALADATQVRTVLSPWPDIAIAAGRGTTAYLRAIRSASEGATFTVLLQHVPGWTSPTWCGVQRTSSCAAPT